MAEIFTLKNKWIRWIRQKWPILAIFDFVIQMGFSNHCANQWVAFFGAIFGVGQCEKCIARRKIHQRQLEDERIKAESRWLSGGYRYTSAQNSEVFLGPSTNSNQYKQPSYALSILSLARALLWPNCLLINASWCRCRRRRAHHHCFYHGSGGGPLRPVVPQTDRRLTHRPNAPTYFAL